jgi:AraC-like DNA-binding protein/CheY-like chemotaxis protein
MVALEIGVDAAVLASQFKAETGLAFTDCLRRRRLDRSADLLITTNMTVKEVWAAVGYNYASNFGRDFRRHFKRSPREYRARAVRGSHDPRPAVDNGDSAAPRRLAARPRVLVVDDDASTQAIVGNFLRLQGYDVSVASAAAEALHLIDQSPPDALLIDYHLPDLDGVATLRSLRQRHPESPRAALFTADWDIYNLEAEIACLRVIVASKLCDLDDIDRLVTYLVN